MIVYYMLPLLDKKNIYLLVLKINKIVIFIIQSIEINLLTTTTKNTCCAIWYAAWVPFNI